MEVLRTFGIIVTSVTPNRFKICRSVNIVSQNGLSRRFIRLMFWGNAWVSVGIYFMHIDGRSLIF